MAADQGAGRGRGLCRCVVLDRSGSGGSLGAEMHGEGKVDWVWKEITPTSPTATFGIIPILVNRNLVRGVFRRYRRWKRDYIGIPMVAFWKASTWTARSKAGGSCASPTGKSKIILMVSNGCQVT